jgi:protein-S-isoprenylcysteine O-methyltransferase Ste14
LTLALMVIASSLAAANWFIPIAGSLALTLIVLRTRREEELLLARFGDEYRAYLKRTRRFIPLIW